MLVFSRRLATASEQHHLPLELIAAVHRIPAVARSNAEAIRGRRGPGVPGLQLDSSGRGDVLPLELLGLGLLVEEVLSHGIAVPDRRFAYSLQLRVVLGPGEGLGGHVCDVLEGLRGLLLLHGAQTPLELGLLELYFLSNK